MQLVYFVLFSNLIGICAALLAFDGIVVGKKARRISAPPRTVALTLLDTFSVTNSSTSLAGIQSANDENASFGLNLTRMGFLTEVAVAADLEAQTKLASNEAPNMSRTVRKHENTVSSNVVETAGAGADVPLSELAVQTPAADSGTSAPAVEQNSTVVLVLKGVAPQSTVEMIIDSNGVNATNTMATELASARDPPSAPLARAAAGMDTNATVAKKATKKIRKRSMFDMVPFARLADGLSGEPRAVDNSTLDESSGNSSESGEEASHNATVVAATNESGATAVVASATIAGVSENSAGEFATESNATRIVEIHIDFGNSAPTMVPDTAAAANLSEVSALKTFNTSTAAITHDVNSSATGVEVLAENAGESHSQRQGNHREPSPREVLEVHIDLHNLPVEEGSTATPSLSPASLEAIDLVRLNTVSPTQAGVASNAAEIKGVSLDFTSNEQNAVAVNASLPVLDTAGPEQPAVTPNASGPVHIAEAIEAAGMSTSSERAVVASTVSLPMFSTDTIETVGLNVSSSDPSVAANATVGNASSNGASETLQDAVDATTGLLRIPKLDGNGTGPAMLILAIPVEQASNTSSTMYISRVGAEGNSSRSSFHDVVESLGRMSKSLEHMNATTLEESRAEVVDSSSMASAVLLQMTASMHHRSSDSFSSHDPTDGSTLGNEEGNLRGTRSSASEAWKNMHEPFMTSFLSL